MYSVSQTWCFVERSATSISGLDLMRRSIHTPSVQWKNEWTVESLREETTNVLYKSKWMPLVFQRLRNVRQPSFEACVVVRCVLSWKTDMQATTRSQTVSIRNTPSLPFPGLRPTQQFNSKEPFYCCTGMTMVEGYDLTQERASVQ